MTMYVIPLLAIGIFGQSIRLGDKNPAKIAFYICLAIMSGAIEYALVGDYTVPLILFASGAVWYVILWIKNLEVQIRNPRLQTSPAVRWVTAAYILQDILVKTYGGYSPELGQTTVCILLGVYNVLLATKKPIDDRSPDHML